MISLKQKGNFRRLKGYLTVNYPESIRNAMEHAGVEGRAALRAATPVDTGLTRDSWHYRTIRTNNGYQVTWYNTNTTVDGLPIVVLLEYGHGTKNGGYVPGKYFIRNAMRPLKAEFSSRLKPEVNESESSN